MAITRVHKREIARHQLDVAVRLYINAKDRSSVITLANAAAGILDRLVQNDNKEAFVDYARRFFRELGGYTPKRQSYLHHIAQKVGAIVHKHLGQNEPNTVELDLEKMAYDSIARAMADYISLYGQKEPFVVAFLSHAWHNTDQEALMKEFEALPEKLRPRRD
jgi:hypothetical protein